MDRIRADWLKICGAAVGPKVRVGARCRFNRPSLVRLGQRVWLEADIWFKLAGPEASIEIGEYVFFARNGHINLLGKLTVGAHSLFGPGCVIVDHNHGLSPHLRIDQQPCIAKSITIGRDVWCGAGVVILAGVTIGDGAVIGAQSLVNRDVPPMAVMAGSPARLIRMRDGGPHGG